MGNRHLFLLSHSKDNKKARVLPGKPEVHEGLTEVSVQHQ